MLTINGNKYYFNYEHNLIKNDTYDIETKEYDEDGQYQVVTKTYYADSKGKRVYNQWVNDSKMYAKADGTLAKEEVFTINGNDYLFDSSGYLVTDSSYTIDDVTYYTNSKGIVTSEGDAD